MPTPQYISQLNNAIERLRSSPFQTIKAALESVAHALTSNEEAYRALEMLLQRERDALGAHSGSFIRGDATPEQLKMEFANTEPRRAAFGYQVLTGLADDPDADSVSNAVVMDGFSFLTGPGVTDVEAIDKFVQMFIDPIRDYLNVALDARDQCGVLVLRYKQRTEWFSGTQILNMAKEVLEQKEGNKLLEASLKQSLYQYLFDNGLEFSIDSSTPLGHGRVDILAIRLQGGGRLVLEAKVFDGTPSHGAKYVAGGIPQSARYANEWNEPIGYLVIYNLKENTILDLPGEPSSNGFMLVNEAGKEIRILVIDLNNDSPASSSSKLEHVQIPKG